MATSVLNNVDAEAEASKYWNKICAEGTEIVEEYFDKMGFKSVLIVDYTLYSSKLISALKGEKVKVFLCVERMPDEVPQNVIICNNIKDTLRDNEINLIIDSDAKKYHLRRFMYDGFNVESSIIHLVFEKIACDEYFYWKRHNVAHLEEMLDNFFELASWRYNNIAVYGSGEIAEYFIKRTEEVKGVKIEQITKNDIIIDNKAQKLNIVKYLSTPITEIFYFGIAKEINFSRNGKSISVVNINEILKELFMNYELAYDIIPKLNKKNVQCFCFLYPDYYRLNKKLHDKGFPVFRKKPLLVNMVQDHRFDNDVKNFFCEYYSKEYPEGILKRPSVIEVDGQKKYAPFNSDYYNIVNGHRVTTDTPPNPRFTIHVFGKCAAMGRFVEDKNTIPSYLQRLINTTTGDYQVVNYGMEAEVEIHKKIKNVCFKKGDIVMIIYRYYNIYKKLNIEYTDLSETICEEVLSHREYFTDTPEHFNHLVNESIAKVIHETLINNFELDSSVLDTKEYFYLDGVNRSDTPDAVGNPEFTTFIERLKTMHVKNITGKIGAIVMNCNPFTNGHRYLIETAAKQCQVLYVFVVEEDKSFFSFKERYALVKIGTRDIPNVVVMPSGSFMISTLTFPEYFNKDAPSETKIDPSGDVEMFGKYIAPALDINVRFAGEEPLDIITKQYNDTMERILPAMGIEFNIIKRKETGGKPISASRVRKCLETKDFREIRNLVPETTFKYLLHKFNT